MQEHIFEEKIARIADVLEQIDELNKMIDFHLSNDEKNTSVEQYEFIRRKYTLELSNLLADFKLNPRFAELAA